MNKLTVTRDLQRTTVATAVASIRRVRHAMGGHGAAGAEWPPHREVSIGAGATQYRVGGGGSVAVAREIRRIAATLSPRWIPLRRLAPPSPLLPCAVRGTYVCARGRANSCAPAPAWRRPQLFRHLPALTSRLPFVHFSICLPPTELHTPRCRCPGRRFPRAVQPC